MNKITADNLLHQMRQTAALARGQEGKATQVKGGGFTHMLGDAINQVNDLQKASAQLQTRYEKGDPNVSLADAMIASQKSGIAFQATLQVRNRFIQAYQDIMNMPI